jgi:hypothetical protein
MVIATDALDHAFKGSKSELPAKWKGLTADNGGEVLQRVKELWRETVSDLLVHLKEGPDKECMD